MSATWERLRRRLRRPVVSLVVPVYNVEPYLAECLDSLLEQTLPDLEVIAVDDGSTDGSPAILRAYAARDRRVRVITQGNAGQGAARNAGVEAARGEFLMFVDSDDMVPRGALAAMVATLRSTGSDFVVGAAQRFSHRRNLEVAWGDTVHDRDRLATTLDEFPDAMLDIIACNRLFRTEFWRRSVPPFEAGIAYEDHVPMLASSVLATRFDVLARVVYRWRIRTDGSSTSQQKAQLRNLEDRIAVKEQAHRLLQEHASPLVFDAWVARTIDIDFQQYLRFALGADDVYRERLQSALRAVFERATDRALDRMRFAPKVRAWLGAQGDWAAVERADAWFRAHGSLPPSRVAGDRMLATFSPLPDFLASVPASMLTLSASETPLVATLRSARWAGSRLTLEGYVVVRGLDAGERAPDVAAWLVASDAPETRVPVPLSLAADDGVDAWADDAAISYRHGRFSVEVDVARLPGTGERTWHLRLRASEDGLVREGGVHRVLDGSAVAQVPGIVATPNGPGIRVPAATSSEEAPAARRIGVHGLDLDGRRLILSVDAVGFSPDELRGAVLQGDTAVIPLAAFEEGRLTFELAVERWGLAATAAPRGGYRLTVGGVMARPVGPLPPQLPYVQVDDHVRVTARMRANGTLGLQVAAPLSDAERSAAGQLRLRTRTHAQPDPGLVLLQCGSGDRLDGDPLALDAALARLRPDLRRVWGLRSGEAVPAGAEAAVVGSERWHRLLRSATTIISDGEIGEWFEPAGFQRWVVTGQGHPAKSMAADARTGRHRAWTHLLAASPDAERLYRADLGFTAPVLTLGQPRTDLLLTPDADAVRDGVRARLGIDPDTTAVLYAPTYRDAQVGRIRSAPLPRALDLAAIDALPGTSVLLRAHPYDAPDAAAWARASGVPDLTDYPRQADLLLAADVAILDHSAIRFDWALTGKPAICFLPDREAYESLRPPLIPYEETAPGPIVTRSDEVVALLSDLPALRAASAPLARAVRARFAALDDGSVAERVVVALF